MSETAGLKVVDDDEWVESSIVPVNPDAAGGAPVTWPVAQTAAGADAAMRTGATTNNNNNNNTASQSTKALSWRSTSRVEKEVRPHDRERQTRARPRLKLLPRTKPLDNIAAAGLPTATRSLSSSTASSSSSSSMSRGSGSGFRRPYFGGGLSTTQHANFGRVGSSSSSTGPANNISPTTLLRLTGYPSSMLLFIADGRRQWAATIEKKHFAALVSAADDGRDAQWQPTHDTARANIHFLLCLAEHWGLRTERAQPEEASQATDALAPVFHACKGCAVPSVLISDAVKLPHVAWMLDDTKSGKTFGDPGRRDADQRNDRGSEVAEEEPGMFWTLEDGPGVEEAETSQLKSPSDNSPAAPPKKHFLKLSSLAASILLTSLSFAGGSGGPLSDELVEHNIAASLSRNRGMLRFGNWQQCARRRRRRFHASFRSRLSIFFCFWCCCICIGFLFHADFLCFTWACG